MWLFMQNGKQNEAGSIYHNCYVRKFRIKIGNDPTDDTRILREWYYSVINIMYINENRKSR